MTTAIGARQVNWYHMVLALIEMNAQIEKAIEVQYPRPANYAYIMMEMSAATKALLVTEGWTDIIPLYKSVQPTLDALVAKYPLINNDYDPCEFKDLRSMLQSLNYVQYLGKVLRTELMFASK